MATTDEFERFIETLGDVPPDAVTACEGWTAHDVVAHLVSGVEMLGDRFEAHHAGRPMPESAEWPDVHARYCAVDDHVLRQRLVDGERRFHAAMEHAGAIEAAQWPVEISWGMPVAELRLHFRVEYALHRWDLIGDDEVNDQMLSQPELLGHSVRMLAAPLLAAGATLDPDPDSLLEIVVRVPDHDDLLLRRDGNGVGLRLTGRSNEPAGVTSDAAARILLVWGRRPADATRVRSALSPHELVRFQRLLSGF